MNDDLIKRSYVAEVVYKALRTPPPKGVLTDTMSLAIALVQDIQSADRPQGEWIGEADGYADGEPVYDIWYCSNCDYAVDDDEPPTWNFCPNCGCRMKGADDE